MSFIKSFTKRNIGRNKRRTIATIIGVMLSAALICTVAGMAMTFRSSLIQNEIEYTGLMHAQFGNVPVDHVDVIDGNVHVEKYGVLSTVGYAKLPHIEKKNAPYFRVKAMNSDAFDIVSVNLSEGRLPENANELVIPDSLKTLGGVDLKIGDTVTMDIGRRKWNDMDLDETFSYINEEDAEDYIESLQYDETVTEEERAALRPEAERLEVKDSITYTVVGISDYYSAYLSVLDSRTFFTCITMASGDPAIDYMGKDTVDIPVVYDEPSRTGTFSEDIKSHFQQMYEDGIIDHSVGYSRTELSRYLGSVGGTVVQMLYSFAIIVTFIILVTSVFVISNSFRISVSDKVTQYGMLASVGATRKQIRKTVLREGFYIGSIGTVMGIILGVGVIAILTRVVNIILPEDVFDLKLVFTFPVWAILITVLLSAVTVYFSCIIPAVKASRIPPVEAIRGHDFVKQNLKGKKLRVNGLTRKLFGIGGVIAAKNLKRSRKQYRTTTVSLVIGTAIFIGLSYFMNMGFRLVSLQYSDLKYNVEIYRGVDVENDVDAEIKKQYEQLESLESVDKVYYYKEGFLLTSLSEYATDDIKEYYEVSRGQADTETADEFVVDVIMINPEDFKEYLDRCGRKTQDPSKEAVLINNTVVAGNKSAFANVDVMRIKEGDTFECYSKNYDEEGNVTGTENFSFPITCITDEKPVGYENVYSDAAYLIVEDDFDIDTTDFVMRRGFIVSPDHEKCVKEIDEVKENDASFGSFYVNDVTYEAENMHRILLLLAIFLYGFITVIVLISVTNIFNTITTNMNIRAREFAMLKSIGMTKREFARMVRLESIMCGSKALLIGIPVGILLSILFNQAARGELDIAYRVPVVPIIVSIVAVFIVVGFTMKYSMSRINKQNIIETIRRQNY